MLTASLVAMLSLQIYGVRVIPNVFGGLYLLIDSTSHVILQRLGHLGFGIFGQRPRCEQKQVVSDKRRVVGV